MRMGSVWLVKDDIGLKPGMLLPEKKDRKKHHGSLTREQQDLVESHLWVAGRLAYSAVCRTGNQTGSFTYDDLRSVGYFALCVAATRYDPSLKFKFSTFAWATVSGYIQHALRDHSRMVRPNRRYLGLRQRVRDLLSAGHSFEETAEVLDITVEDVLNCEMSWKEIYLSIDRQDEDHNPIDIAYHEEEDEIILRSKMVELIHNVPNEDLDLLERYYEGKVKTENEMERAQALIELIREMLEDGDYRYDVAT
jgi:RNA polymerase sigma factor (sigma-70 family)